MLPKELLKDLNEDKSRWKHWVSKAVEEVSDGMDNFGLNQSQLAWLLQQQMNSYQYTMSQTNPLYQVLGSLGQLQGMPVQGMPGLPGGMRQW